METLFEEREFVPFDGNRFGLVYEDALTENVDGDVNIHAIQYPLRDITVAANVYTPAGYDPSKSYAAVVVAHPNGGVKEQVAGLYAQKLAENGYIALAFDASYQGESSGEPRNTDIPANRIEDIRRAADILSTYPGVDANHLGVFGICGGGGYTAAAAQTDKRFKAVATLSLFNSGIVRRDGFRASQTDTINERLEQAAKARQQETEGGEVLYTPNMCETLTPEEADELPFPLYRDGYYYYGKTHAHPGSSFAYTVSSLIELAAFDAASGADLISVPLLMMAGKEADTFYMTVDVFSKATGAPKKELFEIEGAQHIETYWKPEYVKQATDKLVSFFGENL